MSGGGPAKPRLGFAGLLSSAWVRTAPTIIPRLRPRRDRADDWNHFLVFFRLVTFFLAAEAFFVGLARAFGLPLAAGLFSVGDG